MGSLSTMIRNGHGPRRSSGNRKEGGPYRRVVSVAYSAGGPMETYECGHIAMAKRDLIGFTNAARRRCWECRKEEEARRG